MRATRIGFGVAGRRGWKTVVLSVLASLWLAPSSAGASVVFEYVLDAVGESPCGSRLKAIQGTGQSCYDTFDDATPGTGTSFLLEVDAPDIASISAGDTITFHSFALPTIAPIDLGLGDTLNLTLGLAGTGTGAPGDPVIPNPSFVIDELVGTLVTNSSNPSSGRLAVSFPTINIYWSATRPLFGLSGSGIIPFTLGTETVEISGASTTPGVDGTCGVTQPVEFPGFPMPDGGSLFEMGSRFVLGGAVCPSGLNALTNLGERPFSIELQGMLFTPEPGTLLLVSGGLVGLAMTRRRRTV